MANRHATRHPEGRVRGAWTAVSAAVSGERRCAYPGTPDGVPREDDPGLGRRRGLESCRCGAGRHIWQDLRRQLRQRAARAGLGAEMPLTVVAGVVEPDMRPAERQTCNREQRGQLLARGPPGVSIPSHGPITVAETMSQASAEPTGCHLRRVTRAARARSRRSRAGGGRLRAARRGGGRRRRRRSGWAGAPSATGVRPEGARAASPRPCG